MARYTVTCAGELTASIGGHNPRKAVKLNKPARPAAMQNTNDKTMQHTSDKFKTKLMTMFFCIPL